MRTFFSRLMRGSTRRRRNVPDFPKRDPSLTDFRDWLIANGEVTDLSREGLYILYLTFAEEFRCNPLTEHQMLRRRLEAGIERYREPTGDRLWRYRVRSAQVLDLKMRKAAS